MSLKTQSVGVALVITLLTAAFQFEVSAQEQSSKGKLSGKIFRDQNDNSLLDDGEVGAGGVIVDLLDAEGHFIVRTTTDAEGAYTFENLADGIYFIRFEFEVGFAVRSRGISVGATTSVFPPIPVISKGQNFQFLRFGLMNPSSFQGDEASAFKP